MEWFTRKTSIGGVQQLDSRSLSQKFRNDFNKGILEM